MELYKVRGFQEAAAWRWKREASQIKQHESPQAQRLARCWHVCAQWQFAEAKPLMVPSERQQPKWPRCARQPGPHTSNGNGGSVFHTNFPT